MSLFDDINTIARGCGIDHIDHVMRAIDSPACTDTARKSYMTSQSQEHVPHAGLGSVEAGPIVRYWTVRYRHEASAIWNYTQVVACDPFKAVLVVSKPSITETELVREITSDEYEALTRTSP